MGYCLCRFKVFACPMCAGHNPPMFCRARSLVVLSLSLAPACVSCAAAAPSPLNFSVQRVPQAPGVALDSAELVLTGRGYSIARREANVIVTGAREAHPGDSGARPVGRIRGPGQRRTVAEVRVESSPEGTRIFCKVSIQEQVTQAYQVYSAAESGDDTPGATAIERDPGGTAAQNTVWQTVARDKTAERAILSAIAERTQAPPKSGDIGP